MTTFSQMRVGKVHIRLGAKLIAVYLSAGRADQRIVIASLAYVPLKGVGKPSLADRERSDSRTTASYVNECPAPAAPASKQAAAAPASKQAPAASAIAMQPSNHKHHQKKHGLKADMVEVWETGAAPTCSLDFVWR